MAGLHSKTLSQKIVFSVLWIIYHILYSSTYLI
jgi:hypothetical protein